MLLALLVSVAARATPAVPAQEPLRLGVLPFMPAAVLFKNFGPLRDLLAERLGRPVRLETAPSFESFVQRTAEDAYDVVWTAPHFALLAAESGSYQVLATWTKQAAGVVVVRNDSPITTLEQLAGRVVATPPDSAIVTLLTKEHLAGLGLDGANSPRFDAKIGHLVSRAAVLSGEADAAIVGGQILRDAESKQLPLRVLTQSEGVPGVAVLAHQKLPAELRAQIRAQLVQLTEHDAGREALTASGLPAYQPAEPRDLLPLGRFLTDDIRRFAVSGQRQP